MTEEERAQEALDGLAQRYQDAPYLGRGDLIEMIIAITAYGDARAAAERDRTIQAVTGQANALPADVDDAFYAGYKLAIRNAIAAVRGLD